MSWYKQSQSNPKDMIPDGQKGTVAVVFDIQRYGFDNYFIRTALTKTDDNISVSLVITHGDLGNTVFSTYWYYDENESSTSKKCYDAVNKVLQKIITQFSQERMPTNMIWPYIKDGVSNIDKDHETHYGIPHLNYAKNIVISPDWRSNIYGTRYPKHTEHGKKQEIIINKNKFFD